MLLPFMGLPCHEDLASEPEEVEATSKKSERKPLLSTSDSSTNDSLSSDNDFDTDKPTDETDAYLCVKCQNR